MLVRPKTSNVRPRLPSARGQGAPRLSAPVSWAPAKDMLNLNPSRRSARPDHNPGTQDQAFWGGG